MNFRKTVFTSMFYWICSRKIISCQFSLLWYWKCIYWICILKQYISCSIATYLILAKNDYVFNSSQKWLSIWYKLVIYSVEVYDKHIITCHFSYQTLYQPSFIYHPLSLSALGLIKGMIWKMSCNNLYFSGSTPSIKL